MSTDQCNNGNATPPSGDKDKEKVPETEGQEEMVMEQEEKKQRKLEVLMRILNVEDKKANEKLERIRREKQRASTLSLDIKAELEDLLHGLPPRWSEVSDKTNDESTSEEDVYQAPPENDEGRKQCWAEKKREKKGKWKQSGHPEKQTERTQPETEDLEVRRLDEADTWVEGESCQLCSQMGIQCLLPPANSRKKACRYCCLWKVKCLNLPENENCQPMVRHRVPERDIDLLTSRANEADLCMERDQAMLRRLALQVLRQDAAVAWAHQYLHAIGENTDSESESSSSSSSEEEDDNEEAEKWPAIALQSILVWIVGTWQWSAAPGPPKKGMHLKIDQNQKL
ncbi:hypothetical protein C8R45DRAFT_943852 [Mycena sanguinolenta]|nr:hypothetical protein C8R45DRAFT_943852 [Mycena sanguinolenta]